jgi:hypothetical protein
MIGFAAMMAYTHKVYLEAGILYSKRAAECCMFAPANFAFLLINYVDPRNVA